MAAATANGSNVKGIGVATSKSAIRCIGSPASGGSSNDNSPSGSGTEGASTSLFGDVKSGNEPKTFAHSCGVMSASALVSDGDGIPKFGRGEPVRKNVSNVGPGDKGGLQSAVLGSEKEVGRDVGVGVSDSVAANTVGVGVLGEISGVGRSSDVGLSSYRVSHNHQ